MRAGIVNELGSGRHSDFVDVYQRLRLEAADLDVRGVSMGFDDHQDKTSFAG